MRKALAVAALAVMALVGSAGVASATGNDGKWFVCKYVDTPGVDERLQTGQNPISVDGSAIEQDPVVIGSYFQDKHGRSYVLAKDEGQPEPDVSECPPPDVPTTEPETTTTLDEHPTTTVPESTTTSPCTEPRGCPPPPQATNPDGSLRLGGPDGPDGAAPLPNGELAWTGRSSGTLAWIGGTLAAVGVALLGARKRRVL